VISALAGLAPTLEGKRGDMIPTVGVASGQKFPGKDLISPDGDLSTPLNISEPTCHRDAGSLSQTPDAMRIH